MLFKEKMRSFMVVKKWIYNIFMFYVEGFKSMKVGRKLWAIIIIKIIVLFGILKVFFFQDYLDARFSNEQDKADYVLEQLTK